jgi:hypothetical protein
MMANMSRPVVLDAAPAISGVSTRDSNGASTPREMLPGPPTFCGPTAENDQVYRLTAHGDSGPDRLAVGMAEHRVSVGVTPPPKLWRTTAWAVAARTSDMPTQTD